MKNFKGTTGEWYMGARRTTIYSSNNSTDLKITVECNDGEEQLQNIKLIADAGNTIQKCGLLPSELLAQRNELIKSITALRNELVFNGIMSEKNILIKDANAIIEKTKTA